MDTKEIIKELELNYGYKFNEHERNEYSFITDLISDVQKVVSKNESLHIVSNLLYCGGCENECEHEELSSTTLKCLECGNIAVE